MYRERNTLTPCDERLNVYVFMSHIILVLWFLESLLLLFFTRKIPTFLVPSKRHGLYLCC